MPLGPVLSDADKDDIRIRLQELCKHHWVAKGYRKTSVKELCADAGISIGTFYALYPAKEELFLDTIIAMQTRITQPFIDTCQVNPTIAGFASGVKQLLKEYDKVPFLYDFNSPDFIAFINKLSGESLEKMKSDKIEFFRQVVKISNIEPRVSEQESYGVLVALLSTIFAKESISMLCDYFTTFDFMVDNLIPVIFKEADK